MTAPNSPAMSDDEIVAKVILGWSIGLHDFRPALVEIVTLTRASDRAAMQEAVDTRMISLSAWEDRLDARQNQLDLCGVAWVEGPPTDDLKDGRLVLIGIKAGAVTAAWDRSFWRCRVGPHLTNSVFSATEITRHCRIAP